MEFLFLLRMEMIYLFFIFFTYLKLWVTEIIQFEALTFFTEEKLKHLQI